MADEDLAARVAANARLARVPLDPAGAARVARTGSAALTRLADANLSLAMEVEPSTFVVAQNEGRKP